MKKDRGFQHVQLPALRFFLLPTLLFLFIWLGVDCVLLFFFLPTDFTGSFTSPKRPRNLIRVRGSGVDVAKNVYVYEIRALPCCTHP